MRTVRDSNRTNWYIFEILDKHVENICQEICSAEDNEKYWKGVNYYNGWQIWIHEDQIPFPLNTTECYNMKIEDYCQFDEPMYLYKTGFKFIVTIE